MLFTVHAAAQRVTVSGFISDRQSGEPLISAEVLAENTGVVSDAEGRYSIILPIGKTTLGYYYTGYNPDIRDVALVRDTTINIVLNQSQSLSESRVVAVSETGIRAAQMGAMKIPVSVLHKAPVIFGERDILKIAQLLPGIQQGMDGFSSFFVRGGGADENMFLLDGVPLYNISHMLGLFSAFTPESVKATTIYKGAFPARYGGRVSGIVDIRTNEGDLYKLHGAVGTGLLSSKLHLEGPIVREKTTFSVSGRLMHTTLLTPVFKIAKVGLGYGFYDITAKVTHRFSDRDKLSAIAFIGQDEFFYDKVSSEKLLWGNIVAAFRWHHVFSGKWSLSSQMSFNRFGSTAQYSSSSQFAQYNSSYQSLIRDISASSDIVGKVSSRQNLRSGVSVICHYFSPSTRLITTSHEDETDIFADIARDPDYHGWEIAVYGEDEITILPGWTVLPGIRYVLMTSADATYHSLQPRFSTRIGLSDGVAVKAGYARMAQYIHQLSSSSIAMPSDIWVPVTATTRPVISDIGSVGIYYDGLEGWAFSAEAYVKQSHNVLEYRDGASMYGSMGGWESLVEMGMSRSRGVEIYVGRTLGAVTGWTSYTLSKTDRCFPNGYVNGGNWFPYKYDRRHIINIYADWEISNCLDISVSWSFVSGAWLTLPERTVAYMNVAETKDDAYIGRDLAYVSYYYPSRNNYHLAPSHTLNLSVNLKKPLKHGINYWSFDVYNIYNAMNPNLVYMYRDQIGYNNQDKIVLRKVTYLPILPSFSYTYRF